MESNALPNKQVASMSWISINQSEKHSFYTPDVATLGRFGGGFKLKIIKKSPTAEQLVNGENVPSSRAMAQGFGAAFDIWREDRDMKRRMKDAGY